jgi:RNA polymerase sigma factor (sigma-70 family)
MECAPFQEPEPSREERDELWGLVVETIDTVLTPKEREVWTAYVVERASYREIAERMGLRKSRAHQIQKVALVKLRLALESHPTIMEYYTHG